MAKKAKLSDVLPGDTFEEELTANTKASGSAPIRSEKRVALGSYIPEALHWDVKDLALKRSRERGERVTMADLVTEALEDLLTKYRR